METIAIQSWSHLQEELFADSLDPEIGRYRSRSAFRGLGDAAFTLESTLQRLGGPYDLLERHLLRNFRKYAHRNMAAGDSLWHFLALAKHYGLPARILDWTYSPYVALHFATWDLRLYGRDAALYAVNYVQVHEQLPDLLREGLRGEGANVFTADLLSEQVESFRELAGLAPEDDPYLLFFEPPSIDDRIVNQFALFSLMSTSTARLDNWLQAHGEVCRKLVIPAALKWEIRDKLDQANLTERVFFPGMDGLCQWLKRHYSPKDHPTPPPHPQHV